MAGHYSVRLGCYRRVRSSRSPGTWLGSQPLTLFSRTHLQEFKWGDLGRPPPVLPVVLYNGGRRWDAPEEVSELIVPVPGGLERYRPQSHDLLVDEGRYADSELTASRNLVAAWFRLENSRSPRHAQRVLEALMEWLAAPEQTSLRRAFTAWRREVFLPGRLPMVNLPELNN